jgi:hypothetical protein
MLKLLEVKTRMPKPRKRNSLLALAFRHPPYWQGYRSAFDPTQRYYIRIEKDVIIKYYPALDKFEVLPNPRPTLEQMGLQRLPNGKIIPKWNGEAARD